MRIAISLLCVGALFFVPARVSAESARALVAEGNQLAATGEYDKALEAYDKALTEQPDAAEIYFNRGNVYFLKGEWDKAREAYQAAALKTKDLSLEAAAHYNLGNTSFAEGQKLPATDPQKTLSQYGESVRHYQEALRIDAGLREAAQNIEVVRLAMKDLADRMKNAEEAAKEQQKQREAIRKQLEEAIQEQETEKAESRSLDQKMTENPQLSLDDEVRKLASNQEKTRERTGEVAEKLKELQPQQQQAQQPPQPDEVPRPSAPELLEKAQDAQKSAVENLEEHDFAEAQKNQQEALEEMKQALAQPEASKNEQGQCPNPQMSDPGDKQKPGEKAEEKNPSEDRPGSQEGEEKQAGAESARQQFEPAKGASKKQEDGQKGEDQKATGPFSESPENILREEKENRLQLYRAPGGHKPVDKDW